MMTVALLCPISLLPATWALPQHNKNKKQNQIVYNVSK